MHRNHWLLSWVFIAFIVITCISAADKPIVDKDVAATYGNPEALNSLEKQSIQILKSDASRDQKDRACRTLRVIGTIDAIPALAELLVDSNLSHMARYALEPMPYPQAGKALRDAVGKTDGTTKIGIINSLGVRKDKKAVSLLIPLIRNSDTRIASAALWALSRAGTPEAAGAIAELRGSTPAGLQTAVLDASLNIAEQLLFQGKKENAAKIYEELQRAKVPEHIRMGAFAGLLKARPNEAIARLSKAIVDKDPVMRGTAIANIATLKGQGVTEYFAAKLPSLPAETQSLLIGVLVCRGDLNAHPTITTAAASPDSQIRTSAVKALGEIGDASSVKLLTRAIAEGKSNQEKQAAAASLRQLSGDRINETIVQHMKTSAPAIRAKLIGVLQDRRAESVVPDMLDEAAGREKNVRKAAFKALAKLANAKHLPAIIKLLVDMEGDDARREAERAVIVVSRRIDNEANCADMTLHALGTAKGTAAKCSLLRVLQGNGNAKAFKAVRAALDNDEPAVRETALRALSDWSDARAIDTLLEVFRTTKNKTHRVIALRGCVRLLGLGTRPAGDTLNDCRTLLKDAREPKEKKLVLSSLAKVADPEALDIVEPFLDDNDVKAEAELAMLSIARAIVSSDSGKAKAAANNLLQRSKNDTVRNGATEIIRQIEKQ